jgi:hypothetical protein
MKLITFPIRPNETGAAVKDLHNALLSIAMKSGNKFGQLLKDPKFLQQWTIEFNSSTFGDATIQAITIFQEVQMGIKPTGKVNKATAAAINAATSTTTAGNASGNAASASPTASGNAASGNAASGAQTPSDPDAPLKVYGIIDDEWIEPLRDAPVMLFDQDIRNERLLAEGQTDEKGNYTLEYSRRKLNRDDAGGANLIVKVYGSDGDPIYTSPVNYNAAPQLQLNINLGPRADMGSSQFANFLRLIRPLIGDLPIGDLTENKKVHDLTFLINKTGIAAGTLVQLVAAFRFEKWTCLDAEVYYGILAGDQTFADASQPATATAAALPTDLDTTIEQAYVNFWTSTVASMMTTLQQSARRQHRHLFPAETQRRHPGRLAKIANIAPPQEATATQPLPPVYANCKTAGLTTAQQQAFLNLYASTSISSSFWTTLAQDKSFQGATAALNKLQVVYQVAGWTANNTALTAGIIQQFALSSPQDISKLITNTVSDWVTFINNSGTVPAGTTQAATVQALAASIATNVEQLYPTLVLADRFSKATTLQLPNQSVIAGILSNTAFDITTSVPAFIRKNPLPAGTDIAAITNQVLGIQRTHKVTASADNTVTLLADNIQSARQVYVMGKDNFVGKYTPTIGSDASEAIYNNAAIIHAGATHLMGQLSSRVNNPSTGVMTNYSTQLPTSTLMSDYPDLANLFGLGASYCECTNCASFLGIPAYLADLLDFLYERKTTTDGSIPNARAALLANSYDFTDGMTSARWHRRPDIGDIDLNCNNTNVELPYIDIVNELLEDYIIPPVACIKVAMPDDKDGLIYFVYWLIYYLKAGTINHYLWQKIIDIVGNDPKTPICNISLLTDQAVVSDIFLADGENLPTWVGPPLITVNPYGPLFAQWIIRDQYITLKV